MMSLLCSHIVLFWHRRVIYRNSDNHEERSMKQSIASQTKTRLLFVSGALLTCAAMHAAACTLDIFEITSERREEMRVQSYSLLRVGRLFPSSALDPDEVAIRWIQAMYMFLGIALPFANSVLFGLLYFVACTPTWQEYLLFASEICFAWSSFEVLTVSAIFSILQMPKFGNGLIDAGCQECYVVGSRFLPNFAVVCISSVLAVAVNSFLYGRAHKAIYSGRQS